MQTEFDVIVVGAGGSGLAAAVSSAENQASVLVLEKQPQPGGTTGIAVGSFTAAGTSLQRDAGIADDSQAHRSDVRGFAPDAIESRNNESARGWFLEQAAETFEWLRSFGLSFVGPSPEPPNSQPRMHNVVPGAKAYIAALQLRLQKLGGTVLCNATVSELLSEDDRIIGVTVRIEHRSVSFRARRGVILAAGDYAANPDMIARYKGPQFRDIEGINPYACGDGQRLAASAGARLTNMDVTYGPELRFVASRRKPFQQFLPASGWASRVVGAVARCLPQAVIRLLVKRLLVTWQHPEDALFADGAILLNTHGARFVDETRSPEREIAVAAQPGKQAWILLDADLVDRYSAWPHFISTAPDIAYAYVDDYLRLRPDVARRDDQLESLVRVVGMDPRTVRDALDDLETRPAAAVASSAPARQTRRHGPWVLLGPVKAWFTTTEGGASVNQAMQVIDESGRVIPGLYAAGQNGLSGMILWSHGLHIAWAITSGRLAGQSIMSDRSDSNSAIAEGSTNG